MTLATTQVLRKLALDHQPSLYFSSGEGFYPTLPEAWLTHVSLPPWGPSTDRGAPSATQPSRRGTAIMRGTIPPGQRVGGAPNAAGTPITLAAAGADAIGDPAYRAGTAVDEHFLTFGGWEDGSFTRGSRLYVAAAFSELSAAMDPTNAPGRWIAFDELGDTRPVMWTRPPATPVVHAEAEWCGSYVALDSLFQNPVDQDSMRKLLAITYYYFFPLRDPDSAAGGINLGFAEGQWEAVTLFFAGTPRTGAPPFDLNEAPPIALAVTRHDADSRELVSVAPFGSVRLDGMHPRIYVEKGQHTLLFAPPPDSANKYSGAPPGGGAAPETRLDETDPGKGDFPGAEELLTGLVLPFPLNLLAFILWLISMFMGMHNESFTGSEGPAPGAPSPSGDGAGPVGAPEAGTSAGPGAVLADGRRIDDPAHTALRFIDGVNPVAPTTWPTDDPGERWPETEMPHWWDYAGRWGIVVSTGGGWGPGTKRIDRAGRSLGSQNAVRLTGALGSMIPRP